MPNEPNANKKSYRLYSKKIFIDYVFDMEKNNRFFGGGRRRRRISVKKKV